MNRLIFLVFIILVYADMQKEFFNKKYVKVCSAKNIEGRANSLYFLTIVLQKRFIYNYLFDKISLNSFNLPMTDYLISYIFYKIKDNQFIKKENKIIIKKGNIT